MMSLGDEVLLAQQMRHAVFGLKIAGDTYREYSGATFRPWSSLKSCCWVPSHPFLKIAKYQRAQHIKCI